MKEKNRAEEWFRAKHDELAETARANLAAHDLEPGQEAYHLDSLHYATAEQMEAICPTGIDFDRYATLANGSVGYDEADAHWADAAWWDEQARAMWDEVDDIPDDGLYWTSVEQKTVIAFPAHLSPRDRGRPLDAGGASGGQRTTTVLWTPRAGNGSRTRQGVAVARRPRLADGKRSTAPMPRASRGFSFDRPADALIIAARGTRQRPRSETRGFDAFS